jgi:UDP-2-acetamido-3-amino-2,3-dideoxy-glucuronate N-acetyltransferase
MFIHPTAIVEAGVELGSGVHIWHFAHVLGGAKIGDGAMLGQGVFVGARVKVGARCRIQNFANLPEGVELAHDVFVGPHVSFTNVKYPRVERPALGRYEPTRVARGASIGANCTVLPGLSLGEYSMIGAGAVVTRDVPAHALVVGNPARQSGWVGRAGHRLIAQPEGFVCPLTNTNYILVQGQLELIEPS